MATSRLPYNLKPADPLPPLRKGTEDNFINHLLSNAWNKSMMIAVVILWEA